MESNDKAKVMALMSVIVESIIEGDRTIGTPGGYIYAALMTQGCSLETYSKLMAGLVHAGALTKHGDCYKVTQLGKEYVAAVKRIEGRIAGQLDARQ